jgi:hypothetical protein
MSAAGDPRYYSRPIHTRRELDAMPDFASAPQINYNQQQEKQMKTTMTIGATVKYTPEIVTYSNGEPIEGTLVGICHIGNQVRVQLANGKDILVDASRIE